MINFLLVYGFNMLMPDSKVNEECGVMLTSDNEFNEEWRREEDSLRMLL